MMQIALGARERNMHLDVMHPIQLIDEAYRTDGLYEIPAHNVAAVQKQRQRALLIGLAIGVGIGILLQRNRRRRQFS
jgi:glycolate oxidase iron-sulfur subunit